MRISDWSSDVCSSDLAGVGGGHQEDEDQSHREGVEHRRSGEILEEEEEGFRHVLEHDIGKAAAAVQLDIDAGAAEDGEPQHREDRRHDDHAEAELPDGASARNEIGRASWRERVCRYVEISVVAVSLKQTYKCIHV